MTVPWYDRAAQATTLILPIPILGLAYAPASGESQGLIVAFSVTATIAAIFAGRAIFFDEKGVIVSSWKFIVNAISRLKHAKVSST